MPDQDAAAFNRGRLHRTIAIKNGALPTLEELLSGMPCLRESDELDCQAFVDTVMPDLEVGMAMPHVAELVDALTAVRLRFDRPRLARAQKAAEKAGSHEIAARMLIYHAFRGGMSIVRGRLAAMALAEVREHKSTAPFFLATAIGLATSTAPSMERARHAGFKSLDQIMMTTELLRKLASEAAAPTPPAEDDDFMQDVLDDRAGITRLPIEKAKPSEAAPEGLTVITEHGPRTTSHRRDVAKVVDHIVGKVLPLVPKPDLMALRTRMDAEFPWATEVTATILRDMAPRRHAYVRPTLLVSPPGTGKSRYARALLEAAGLATELIPLGGVADSAIGGTSSQWGSARPSDALSLIARAEQGNVGIVIDEIDKAKSSHNGSPTDALLLFLERHTSKRVRDPGLEVEVDLSCVSWIATANDIDLVPRPLQDRMRVLKMPAPGPEHIGEIARRIIAEIVVERGEHPGFVPPLAQDELELARAAWQTGSLRQLRRIVETIVEGREQLLGRC